MYQLKRMLCRGLKVQVTQNRGNFTIIVISYKLIFLLYSHCIKRVLYDLIYSLYAIMRSIPSTSFTINIRRSSHGLSAKGGPFDPRGANVFGSQRLPRRRKPGQCPVRQQGVDPVQVSVCLTILSHTIEAVVRCWKFAW